MCDVVTENIQNFSVLSLIDIERPHDVVERPCYGLNVFPHILVSKP